MLATSINDAGGVLFLDTKGEETGGLALSKLRDNNLATLTFDYTFIMLSPEGKVIYRAAKQREAGQRIGALRLRIS